MEKTALEMLDDVERFDKLQKVLKKKSNIDSMRLLLNLSEMSQDEIEKYLDKESIEKIEYNLDYMIGLVEEKCNDDTVAAAAVCIRRVIEGRLSAIVGPAPTLKGRAWIRSCVRDDVFAEEIYKSWCFLNRYIHNNSKIKYREKESSEEIIKKLKEAKKISGKIPRGVYETERGR